MMLLAVLGGSKIHIQSWQWGAGNPSEQPFLGALTSLRLINSTDHGEELGLLVFSGSYVLTASMKTKGRAARRL